MIGNFIKNLTRRGFPEVQRQGIPSLKAELDEARSLEERINALAEQAEPMSPRSFRARRFREAATRKISRLHHAYNLAVIEAMLPQAQKADESALASIADKHADANKRLADLQAAHAQRTARCEALKARRGEVQQRASEPVNKAKQELDQAELAGDEEAAQAASGRLTAALRARRQIDEELIPLDSQIEANNIVVADTEAKIESIQAEIQGIEEQAVYYRRQLCAIQLDKAAIALIRAALPYYADGGQPMRPGAGHGLSVQLGHSQTLRRMAAEEIRIYTDFGDYQLRELGRKLVEHSEEAALAGCLAELEALPPKHPGTEEGEAVVVTLDPQQRAAA